jgi:eukaryotic-like serine/threonine-protein kinase
MRITNYQLSPQYEFIEDTDFLAARGYNSIALWDNEEQEFLLLNPLITTFLKAFQQPTTLKEVVRIFQKDTEDSTKDIEAALKPFFKSMRDRGIIEQCKSAQDEPEPEMPNGEGLRIGDYTLHKRIDCTPPIDIYVAIDDNGQKVLLKRLLFEPNFPEKFRPEIRRNFAHEFKILQILRGCPNICPLILFDEKAEYAVIQFFEGDTLRQLYKQKTHFNLNECVFILNQILEAAAYMHSCDILHGDMHYSNVLINENNIVRIIDFDLALKLGQRQKKGIAKGGIKDFIPPERIDDSAFEVVSTPPDFRAEVFQIGVLAYYLFVSDYPFKGETWKKLAFAIQNDEPNWEKANLPSEISQFLQKALAKKPEDRFQSAIPMWAAWQHLSKNTYLLP